MYDIFFFILLSICFYYLFLIVQKQISIVKSKHNKKKIEQENIKNKETEIEKQHIKNKEKQKEREEGKEKEKEKEKEEVAKEEKKELLAEDQNAVEKKENYVDDKCRTIKSTQLTNNNNNYNNHLTSINKDAKEKKKRNNSPTLDTSNINCEETEKEKVITKNNENKYKKLSEMDQFIKNIPPIQEEDKKYIQEKCIDKKEFREESKNSLNKIKGEHDKTANLRFNNSQENIKKEDNVEMKTQILSEKDFEKEEEQQIIKEKNKNAILRENTEELKKKVQFNDDLKMERNCYSDNCVQEDTYKETSTSDESSNDEKFESLESSENESKSTSSESNELSDSDSDSDSNSVSNSMSESVSGSDSEEDSENDENSSSDEVEDDEKEGKKKRGIYDSRDDIIKGKSVDEIKEIGNKYFKEQDYYNAIYYYNKAIKACKDKSVKSVLYSNRAACNVLLKNWDVVIQDCTKSINCNDIFVKSYIRRSKAYEQLEKYNNAVEDLNKALTLDPSLKPTYEKTQKKLTILAEQQLNKEKEEMMGKLKDFGNLLLGKVGLSLDNFEVQKNSNNDGSFNIQFKQNK